MTARSRGFSGIDMRDPRIAGYYGGGNGSAGANPYTGGPTRGTTSTVDSWPGSAQPTHGRAGGRGDDGASQLPDAEAQAKTRSLLAQKRADICKYVLYIQRDPHTNEPEEACKYAILEAEKREQEVMFVNIADIPPERRPPWMMGAPLLVVRRPDGQFLFKGSKAIQYLVNLNQSEPASLSLKDNLPGSLKGQGSSMASYMSTAIRDPRYERTNKTTSDEVSSYDAKRKQHDKMINERRKGVANDSLRLPDTNLDAKAPLDEAFLFKMGQHPSQLRQKEEQAKRRELELMRRNPNQAALASGAMM